MSEINILIIWKGSKSLKKVVKNIPCHLYYDKKLYQTSRLRIAYTARNSATKSLLNLHTLHNLHTFSVLKCNDVCVCHDHQFVMMYQKRMELNQWIIDLNTRYASTNIVSQWSCDTRIFSKYVCHIAPTTVYQIINAV